MYRIIREPSQTQTTRISELKSEIQQLQERIERKQSELAVLQNQKDEKPAILQGNILTDAFRDEYPSLYHAFVMDEELSSLRSRIPNFTWTAFLSCYRGTNDMRRIYMLTDPDIDELVRFLNKHGIEIPETRNTMERPFLDRPKIACEYSKMQPILGIRIMRDDSLFTFGDILKKYHTQKDFLSIYGMGKKRLQKIVDFYAENGVWIPEGGF